MLDKLSQKVDASVHVYGTNEWDQLKEQFSGLEWEQKGTIPKYLL